MTLPVYPNSISLNQIQTEFGGTNPIGINEYYANGAYVASGTIGYPGGVATAIPSSGTISLGNFHGASKLTYTANWSAANTTYSDTFGVVPQITNVRLQVYSNGTYTIFTDGGAFVDVNGNWATPTTAGIGNSLYCKITRTSINGSSGSHSNTATQGPALLSSTFTVAVTAGNGISAGSEDDTYKVEIATDSGMTNIVSRALGIRLQAAVTP